MTTAMTRRDTMSDTKEKPGKQSTEFFLSVAAQVIGAVLASGVVTDEAWVQILGAAVSCVNALVYTLSRSSVKNNAVRSAALVEAAKLGKPQG